MLAMNGMDGASRMQTAEKGVLSKRSYACINGHQTCLQHLMLFCDWLTQSRHIVHHSSLTALFSPASCIFATSQQFFLKEELMLWLQGKGKA